MPAEHLNNLHQHWSQKSDTENQGHEMQDIFQNKLHGTVLLRNEDYRNGAQ